MDMNVGPTEIHKYGHEDVGPVIWGKTLEDMFIMDPCDIDIYEFLYINKGKRVFNHHFENDPVYDTIKE